MNFFDFFKNLIDAREEWLRKKNVNDVSVYYNTIPPLRSKSVVKVCAK